MEDQDLFGQDPISLLLQKKILGILEEDLGPSKLVVCLAEHNLADLGRPLAALVLEIKD